MNFEESLRLSIALGLTIFLVLLRFDSDRIMRSDYFRYRYPWLGPVSYYGLVVLFAIGIAIILPNGRGHLFLTRPEPGTMLPLVLGFAAVGILNAVAFAFRWYGGISPLPTSLLPSRLLGAGASAVADELQFRSIVLGMLIFAGIEAGIAVIVQALLYGLAQRRLWRERQWYFLIGSVILGYACGWATVLTGSVLPAMVGHFVVIAALFAFAGGRLRQRPI
ncbi:MAG TPA: CPBP family intramembrane glutamic endopeptidase [Candidatus Limnocylindria bacterium]|nr:CPBP family intramembrane glutamic endopeptidase [Candidatus Limnocylindria bacterium]